MAATKKEYVSYVLSWEGIEITIKYCKDFLKSTKVSHMYVKAYEPLPITETGFRSVWLFEGQLDGRTPVEYVLEALEQDSNTQKWKNYLKDREQRKLEESQLSLF